MHLKKALIQKLAERQLPPGTVVEEARQPGIPFLYDLKVRTERIPQEHHADKGLEMVVKRIKQAFTGEREPTKFREHAEIEAIPQIGAYAGLGALGATGGAGIGALVAGKGNRGLGAATGGFIGGVTAPILLALAQKQGLLKLQSTRELEV